MAKLTEEQKEAKKEIEFLNFLRANGGKIEVERNSDHRELFWGLDVEPITEDFELETQTLNLAIHHGHVSMKSVKRPAKICSCCGEEMEEEYYIITLSLKETQ